MGKLEKIKNIITSYPIMLIAFLTLLKPEVVYDNKIINLCFNLVDISLGVIVLLVAYKYILKSKITLIFILEIAILMLSTIINNNNIWYMLKFYTPFIILFFYMEFLIANNKSKKMLNSICIITGLYCIINFISVLMNSNIGSTTVQDRMYFLGYDNSMANILIMSAFIFILTSYLKFDKIKFEYILAILMIFGTCFMVRSATAKVGVVMVILFLLLMYKKNKLTKIFNYNSYLIITVILFLFIVVFRNQDYFKEIIINILQRDLTFSGRTEIWDASIEQIKHNPFFGIGVSKMEDRNTTLGIYHAHSTFLNIVLEGGIIYLAVYVLKLILLGKNLKKVNNSEFKNIISFAIFTYYIMGIGEVYVRNQLLYIIFYIAYYGEKIVQDFSRKDITVISSTDYQKKNAGPKAPEDINDILKKNYNTKIVKIYRDRFFKAKVLYNFIKTMFSDNIVLIQFPMILKKSVYKILYRNKSIVLIHDIAGLRMGEEEILNKEIEVFKCFDYVIVHNQVMKEFLEEKGIKNNKIFVLELFDYLCSEISSNKNTNIDAGKNVVFAGNLAKSEFLNEIDENNINFNLHLYGIGYNKKDTEKIKYNGSYEPEQLPNKLDGNLGLVWDGKCDESDEEITYKKYTKYNNPHKLSCYLAANIPVIVWKKAAVAKFVEENNIGYLISNIYEINDIDCSNYEEKIKNVNIIRDKVREGYYTKKIIQEVMNDIENGEK